MAELPSGTVTFLVNAHGGVHIRSRSEGDSRFAVFASAPAAGLPPSRFSAPSPPSHVPL
jgi:hypothetical protein